MITPETSLAFFTAHVAAVFHDAAENSTDLEEVKYSSYVEYGRRFEKMLNEIKKDCGK